MEDELETLQKFNKLLKRLGIEGSGSTYTQEELDKMLSKFVAILKDILGD